MSVTIGKKKASARKETVAVSATILKIVRKKQNTLPPQLPSQPFSRGRSVSKKRSIRDESNHGSILRQPCRCYLKGTCTRKLCEYWHPPRCQLVRQKRVVSWETRVCFLISRLMNNQIKGRGKATSKKGEKVKTKALWLLRKAYQNWVVYHKTRMHSLLKELKSFGETSRRKSFTKSTLRYASIRDKKGPSLGTMQVKPLHHRSPCAVKFEDRSREETERQDRCAQGKVYDLATSRSPTTVMTANVQVRTREEAPVCVEQLDLFVKVIFLEETPEVLSLGETLRRTWVHVSLAKRSKSTSHQKWQDNWWQYIYKYITMYHLWFLEYQRVLPQLRFICFVTIF